MKPRKIIPRNTIGFVWCKGMGLLPCENEQDKKELIALAQLYREGVRKGDIIERSGGLPQTFGGSKATVDFLWAHIRRNTGEQNLEFSAAKKRLRDRLKMIKVEVKYVPRDEFS